jgi:hypothetical protein
MKKNLLIGGHHILADFKINNAEDSITQVIVRQKGKGKGMEVGIGIFVF